MRRKTLDKDVIQRASELMINRRRVLAPFVLDPLIVYGQMLNEVEAAGIKELLLNCKVQLNMSCFMEVRFDSHQAGRQSTCGPDMATYKVKIALPMAMPKLSHFIGIGHPAYEGLNSWAMQWERCNHENMLAINHNKSCLRCSTHQTGAVYILAGSVQVLLPRGAAGRTYERTCRVRILADAKELAALRSDAAYRGVAGSGAHAAEGGELGDCVP